MSLDETSLSNGDVYTILTNKAAHGGKGALAAMIRGVASDTVSAILRKVPLKQRRKVKTVTTDLSSAMMLTVRKVFPGASLVNDRFHVQQLVSEAVDQLRIRHRWEVLDAENRAIREHRRKRKGAKSKEERDLIGQWEPERMENGETMPQIMARSRHIILKHKSKWNDQQRIRARILFTKFPDLETAYGLFRVSGFSRWVERCQEYSVASLNMKNLMSPAPRNYAQTIRALFIHIGVNFAQII